MNESFPSPEAEAKIKREQVVDAYKKFVERGVTNPDELDLSDPEVQEANKLFDKWRMQEETSSAGNEELKHRTFLSQTMLKVDAGFNDPRYLDEVLNDWLEQDAQNEEERSDNPERAETLRQIATAQKKIKGILGQSE